MICKSIAAWVGHYYLKVARWLTRKRTVWIECTFYELLDGSQNQNRRLFLNLLNGVKIKLGFMPRDYEFDYLTPLKSGSRM
jgi:hypothetical protein